MQEARNFQNYSNDQLMDELRRHQSDGLRCLVRVLRILEEVDRRKLYVELGYPSLYQFCLTVLRMSEHAAYLRVAAARAARRFPVIFEMLERGELHLTAVKLLAPHFTAENHASLLGAATHKTKREIEEMLAARFPQPAVSESIRRLPVPAAPQAPSAPRASFTPQLLTPLQAPTVVAPPSTQLAPPRRESIEPLSPERYAVRFTASARCRQLIERAKQLMSHRSPNADVAELVEAGLVALVEKLEKQKFKKTSRPRQQQKKIEPKNSRYIAAEVARAVDARDDGRCTYVGPDGHRCSARSSIQFDHIDPVALGGKPTADNLRLRCFAHNQHTAREQFGDEYVTLRAQGFRPVSRKRRDQVSPRDDAGEPAPN